ncbi:response regulator receiver domain-containing protein [Flammeovirgaceae bacterium 311]|nr:response regulator receiver domain-containing protein [Flammeovirgaceae bacterium 311]
MPVMDGFEFLEEATSTPELNLSQTKIYVTTSSVLPKDKEKVAAYPIAGFIPKPLNQNILKEILG